LIILPIGPGAQFYWFAPSASRGRACHIRDCDTFPFPSHSLPASSLPLGGLEPPHPCPLGCRRKSLPFPLGWHTILAHPRVRGTVKRRRGVFMRTISNWQKVSATSRGLHTISAQFSLLTDTRPRLLDGCSIHSLHTPN
jgi:hypothetical protein